VTGAEKSHQQALSNIKQQQVQLQYYTIKAPFIGTVGNIPVKVGDFVNTSTQLTRITQNKPLEVYISIPNQQVP
jgi:multidrug efflux pump subunit AcrA (membrane-fusion protein)